MIAAPPPASVGWVNKPGVNNWVDRVGGLPKKIKRVALHLMAKGFTQSHAIAVAVNVIKKHCRGGVRGNPADYLNWPGRQKATAKTIAEGCKEFAEWMAKRAKARATKPASTEKFRGQRSARRR